MESRAERLEASAIATHPSCVHSHSCSHTRTERNLFLPHGMANKIGAHTLHTHTHTYTAQITVQQQRPRWSTTKDSNNENIISGIIKLENDKKKFEDAIHVFPVSSSTDVKSVVFGC